MTLLEAARMEESKRLVEEWAINLLIIRRIHRRRHTEYSVMA